MSLRSSFPLSARPALLLGLLLAAGSALAQSAARPVAPRLTPLTRDPGRAARSQAIPSRPSVPQPRAAALTLPFFDDFARDGRTAPNATLWEPGGAYQNNRFPDSPPTKGAATLDGFNAYGEPYPGLSPTAVSDLDTLMSRPINLAGRPGASLTFWWQRGGVGDNVLAPGARARLVLEFDDGTDFWSIVPEWEKRGTGNDSAFARAVVPIPAAYCTANFRFRFRFLGTANDIIHCWNLDYVEIDPDRTGTLRDIATVRPPLPALRRYAAMPVWQYNAAAAVGSEMADSTGTTIRNLDLDTTHLPTGVTNEGRLAVSLADGTPLNDAVFLTSAPLVPAGGRELPFGGLLRAPLPAQPVPLTPDYKQLTQTFRITSGDPDTARLINDVITRTDELADYYAYDDGSAEIGFSLSAMDPSSAAYAYDADVADQVAGVSIYLPGDLASGKRLFVEVWPDNPLNPGHPADNSLVRVGFNVPADSILRPLQRWYHIWFTPQQMAQVSGRFYVGYSQPANSGITNIGFDLNDTLRASGRLHFRFGLGGTWDVSTVAGALMVRPRMNNNGAVGLPEAVGETALAVFPNPVSSSEGVVRLQGQFTAVTLFDALGRPVRTLPANAATLDVRDLPPGIYALRFRTAQGGVTTRRLVVTQ